MKILQKKWLMKQTLVTWVPQSRLAFGHSAHRLAIGPPALAKPKPSVCSLAATIGRAGRFRVFFDRVRPAV